MASQGAKFGPARRSSRAATLASWKVWCLVAALLPLCLRSEAARPLPAANLTCLSEMAELRFDANLSATLYLDSDQQVASDFFICIPEDEHGAVQRVLLRDVDDGVDVAADMLVAGCKNPALATTFKLPLLSPGRHRLHVQAQRAGMFAAGVRCMDPAVDDDPALRDPSARAKHPSAPGQQHLQEVARREEILEHSARVHMSATFPPTSPNVDDSTTEANSRQRLQEHARLEELLEGSAHVNTSVPFFQTSPHVDESTTEEDLAQEHAGYKFWTSLRPSQSEDHQEPHLEASTVVDLAFMSTTALVAEEAGYEQDVAFHEDGVGVDHTAFKLTTGTPAVGGAEPVDEPEGYEAGDVARDHTEFLRLDGVGNPAKPITPALALSPEALLFDEPREFVWDAGETRGRITGSSSWTPPPWANWGARPIRGRALVDADGMGTSTTESSTTESSTTGTSTGTMKTNTTTTETLSTYTTATNTTTTNTTVTSTTTSVTNTTSTVTTTSGTSSITSITTTTSITTETTSTMTTISVTLTGTTTSATSQTATSVTTRTTSTGTTRTTTTVTTVTATTTTGTSSTTATATTTSDTSFTTATVTTRTTSSTTSDTSTTLTTTTATTTSGTSSTTATATTTSDTSFTTATVTTTSVTTKTTETGTTTSTTSDTSTTVTTITATTTSDTSSTTATATTTSVTTKTTETGTTTSTTSDTSTTLTTITATTTTGTSSTTATATTTSATSETETSFTTATVTTTSVTTKTTETGTTTSTTSDTSTTLTTITATTTTGTSSTTATATTTSHTSFTTATTTTTSVTTKTTETGTTTSVTSETSTFLTTITATTTTGTSSTTATGTTTSATSETDTSVTTATVTTITTDTGTTTSVTTQTGTSSITHTTTTTATGTTSTDTLTLTTRTFTTTTGTTVTSTTTTTGSSTSSSTMTPLVDVFLRAVFRDMDYDALLADEELVTALKERVCATVLIDVKADGFAEAKCEVELRRGSVIADVTIQLNGAFILEDEEAITAALKPEVLNISGIEVALPNNGTDLDLVVVFDITTTSMSSSSTVTTTSSVTSTTTATFTSVTSTTPTTVTSTSSTTTVTSTTTLRGLAVDLRLYTNMSELVGRYRFFLLEGQRDELLAEEDSLRAAMADAVLKVSEDAALAGIEEYAQQREDGQVEMRLPDGVTVTEDTDQVFQVSYVLVIVGPQHTLFAPSILAQVVAITADPAQAPNQDFNDAIAAGVPNGAAYQVKLTSRSVLGETNVVLEEEEEVAEELAGVATTVVVAVASVSLVAAATGAAATAATGTASSAAAMASSASAAAAGAGTTSVAVGASGAAAGAAAGAAGGAAGAGGAAVSAGAGAATGGAGAGIAGGAGATGTGAGAALPGQAGGPAAGPGGAVAGGGDGFGDDMHSERKAKKKPVAGLYTNAAGQTFEISSFDKFPNPCVRGERCLITHQNTERTFFLEKRWISSTDFKDKDGSTQVRVCSDNVIEVSGVGKLSRVIPWHQKFTQFIPPLVLLFAGIAILAASAGLSLSGYVMLFSSFFSVGAVFFMKPGSFMLFVVNEIKNAPPEKIRATFWLCINTFMALLPAATAFFEGWQANEIIGYILGSTIVFFAFATKVGNYVIQGFMLFLKCVTAITFTGICFARMVEAARQSLDRDFIGLFMAASLQLLLAASEWVQSQMFDGILYEQVDETIQKTLMKFDFEDLMRDLNVPRLELNALLALKQGTALAGPLMQRALLFGCQAAAVAVVRSVLLALRVQSQKLLHGGLRTAREEMEEKVDAVQKLVDADNRQILNKEITERTACQRLMDQNKLLVFKSLEGFVKVGKSISDSMGRQLAKLGAVLSKVEAVIPIDILMSWHPTSGTIKHSERVEKLAQDIHEEAEKMEEETDLNAQERKVMEISEMVKQLSFECDKLKERNDKNAFYSNNKVERGLNRVKEDVPRIREETRHMIDELRDQVFLAHEFAELVQQSAGQSDVVELIFEVPLEHLDQSRFKRQLHDAYIRLGMKEDIVRDKLQTKLLSGSTIARTEGPYFAIAELKALPLKDLEVMGHKATVKPPAPFTKHALWQDQMLLKLRSAQAVRGGAGLLRRAGEDENEEVAEHLATIQAGHHLKIAATTAILDIEETSDGRILSVKGTLGVIDGGRKVVARGPLQKVGEQWVLPIKPRGALDLTPTSLFDESVDEGGGTGLGGDGGEGSISPAGRSRVRQGNRMPTLQSFAASMALGSMSMSASANWRAGGGTASRPVQTPKASDSDPEDEGEAATPDNSRGPSKDSEGGQPARAVVQEGTHGAIALHGSLRNAPFAETVRNLMTGVTEKAHEVGELQHELTDAFITEETKDAMFDVMTVTLVRLAIGGIPDGLLEPLANSAVAAQECLATGMDISFDLESLATLFTNIIYFGEDALVLGSRLIEDLHNVFDTSFEQDVARAAIAEAEGELSAEIAHEGMHGMAPRQQRRVAEPFGSESTTRDSDDDEGEATQSVAVAGIQYGNQVPWDFSAFESNDDEPPINGQYDAILSPDELVEVVRSIETEEGNLLEPGIRGKVLRITESGAAEIDFTGVGIQTVRQLDHRRLVEVARVLRKMQQSTKIFVNHYPAALIFSLHVFTTLTLQGLMSSLESAILACLPEDLEVEVEETVVYVEDRPPEKDIIRGDGLGAGVGVDAPPHAVPSPDGMLDDGGLAHPAAGDQTGPPVYSV